VTHHPSTGAADKKAKIELLKTHFKASWVEIEEVMPLEQLRSGYDTLHFTLEGKYSRYHQERLAEQINDELPSHSAPPKVDGALISHDAMMKAVVEPLPERQALDHTDIDGTPAFLRRTQRTAAETKPFSQAEYVDAVAAE
jgi:hypothetical protein